MVYFTTPKGALYNQDCREWLRGQPERSLDCVVTSPPYWGLRNYGNVTGEIGQEDTPQEYIETLSEVFTQVNRCLSQTGSLWLNLGDSYYGGAPVTQPKDAKGLVRDVQVERKCLRCGAVFQGTPTRRYCSSKCGGASNARRSGFERPKCLLGLPWRVASRLVEDGWVLRNAVVWHKPNAMPSPHKDRLSLTYEHLFHFVKRGVWRGSTYDGSYYYKDSEMKVPSKTGGLKNRGDVWIINTRARRCSHFASFPEDLISKPMAATTPPDGVVYDPFMGSGVVAQVAERLGFRWKGTETNEEYCSLAARLIRVDPLAGSGEAREAEPETVSLDDLFGL